MPVALRFLDQSAASGRQVVDDFGPEQGEFVVVDHVDVGLEASDVLRAMALLPPAQREVLILAAVGHVSYREMADICGVAVGTIKSRIARARASLSATIESGILPDYRHNFVLRGEVLDAFVAELSKIAPQHVIDRHLA